MEIVQARQQRIWRLPAVANFTLGSMGAAFYLVALANSVFANGWTLVIGAWHGAIAAMLILGGFFALLFEAGNPLKSYLSILNVRQSWMSRELLFALVFMLCVGLDAILSHSLLRAAAGIMAFMFIVSQAFIIYKSRAILAWNVWPIPPLFVLSGLSSGFGLWLLSRTREGVSQGMLAIGTVMVFCCLGMLVYFLFAYEKEKGAFRTATRALRAPSALGLGVVAGLLLPGVWAAMAMILPKTSFSGQLMPLAGAFLIYGAWRRNRDLITKAGYFRSIDIKL